MEEHAIKYQQTYNEFKIEFDYEEAELKKNMERTAKSFVRIGYLLKVARDTDILKESPYESYIDFAEKEYHLDKSQVSRFININDKYSIGGNSEELDDRYKGFEYSKLAIMLTLPDKLAEELTPEYTKSEIQAIKEEVEEEKKITDIEVMMEDKPEVQKDFSMLDHAIFYILENEPELFVALADEHFFGINPKDERIPEIMAPAGTKTYSVRIPTIGKYMLMFKDGDISLVNIRSNTKEKVTASDIGRSLVKIYDVNQEKDPADDKLDSSEDLWEHIYDAPFPKKEEVAPVQHKAEPAKKKETKVSPSKKPEKKEYVKPEIIERPGPTDISKIPSVSCTACQPAKPADVWKDETGENTEKPASKTKEGDSKNEEPHETGVSEAKNEEKPESTTWSGNEEDEKTPEPETEDLSLDNPEDDRYEYMEPDRTINTLEELLGDYEQAVRRLKSRDEDTTYIDVTMDLAYAEALYNAVQELKYMKKLGGSRR